VKISDQHFFPNFCGFSVPERIIVQLQFFVNTPTLDEGVFMACSALIIYKIGQLRVEDLNT